MSIIEVDRKPALRQIRYEQKLPWDTKFKRTLYHSNYAKYLKKQPYFDMFQEQARSQCGLKIISMIRQKRQPQSWQLTQFYDPQNHNTCFSLYSSFIPLQDEICLNDELVNTFPYLLHLKQTQKLDRMRTCHYQKIKKYFQNSKEEGPDFVKKQWQLVKQQYLCNFDSITSLKILIQIMRKDISILDILHPIYGNTCLKQIFKQKILKTMLYIHKPLKIHKKLNISVQTNDPINEKTLSTTMKTYYCSICMLYDCQKHKLQLKVGQYGYHYISSKNRISQQENIKNIIKLLKYYEVLKSDTAIVEENNRNQACSQQCYKILQKKDIPRLYQNRHRLISPLAKSLLSMGTTIFSYKPCQIHPLFQPPHTATQITCNQIFLHFTQQSNLQQLISQKMNKSQNQYLLSQTNKIINIKMPTNTQKIKRLYYLEKRNLNQNPQFAICMHCFVGQPDLDVRCQGCVCAERGFCLSGCLCADGCAIRRVGCCCNGMDSCQTQKCICFINKIQCHPEICQNCFAGKRQKKNCCKNDQILRNLNRKVNIGISNIPNAGLGAFAGQKFNKNDFICKYTGEHISSDVDIIRESMIQNLSFYNFDSPNGKIIAASIDARFMGNKARFINHGNEGEANLKAENFFSNGTELIALIAARDIEAGEELFFNYDGKGFLYANHRDKYPFIRPPKKN